MATAMDRYPKLCMTVKGGYDYNQRNITKNDQTRVNHLQAYLNIMNFLGLHNYP